MCVFNVLAKTMTAVATQIGIAARTSKIECCFKNTVDMEIRKAVTQKIIRHPGFEKCLLFHAASITATEPIT